MQGVAVRTGLCFICLLTSIVHTPSTTGLFSAVLGYAESSLDTGEE